MDTGFSPQGYQVFAGVQGGLNVSPLVEVSWTRQNYEAFVIDLAHNQVGLFNTQSNALGVGLSLSTPGPGWSLGGIAGEGPVYGFGFDPAADIDSIERQSTSIGAGWNGTLIESTGMSFDAWKGGLPLEPTNMTGETATIFFGTGSPSVGVGVHGGIGNTTRQFKVTVPESVMRALVDAVYYPRSSRLTYDLRKVVRSRSSAR